jgi:hypothetical protein
MAYIGYHQSTASLLVFGVIDTADHKNSKLNISVEQAGTCRSGDQIELFCKEIKGRKSRDRVPLKEKPYLKLHVFSSFFLLRIVTQQKIIFEKNIVVQFPIFCIYICIFYIFLNCGFFATYTSARTSFVFLSYSSYNYFFTV